VAEPAAPAPQARGPRWARAAGAVLASALPLVAIAWTLGLARQLGIALFTEQFLALMLGLALALVYLRLPARRGATRDRVPWYDALAAALGLGASVYVAVRYEALVEAVAYDPSKSLVYGTLLLVLVLEGLRRTAGAVLAGIVLAFLAYGQLGHLVPGALEGRSLAYERMVGDLTLDPNALLGTPIRIGATVVVAFVLFGHMLNATGGGRFFTALATALMGRFRGGSAKIAIVASSLFGSISGSAVSNVVSTGVVTIPLMRRGGYPPAVAGAIEAVASTGGQLMPPIMGASAFLMAEFLDIGYAEVVLAALVPAVLYFAALFIQADLRAAREGLTRVPPGEIPGLAPTFAGGWFFLLPFVVLIAALFWLHVQPEEAALDAVLTLLVFVPFVVGEPGARGGLLARMRRTLGIACQALHRTGVTVLDILMITAAAGLIMGVLNFSGFSFALTLLLVDIGAESLVLLLVVSALICIVLGMGMPTIGVYVLLAVLVAPALTELGLAPKAAHLFVLYFGMMSMITPPVAIAAFAAATLAQAPPMRTGLEAVRFGWPAYVVPFLFVASPSLLLLGTPGEVTLAVVTALAGVWLASVGTVGYLTRPLDVKRRIAFVAAGLLLLAPAGTFGWGPATDIAGAVLGLFLGVRELAPSRLGSVLSRH